MTADEKKPTDWTEAHQRLALILAAELLVERMKTSKLAPADLADATMDEALVARGRADIATRSAWREWLEEATTLSASRIEREMQRIDALATADDATRAAIAAERKRHERALRKLTSGRYVVETSERFDVVYPGGSRVERDTREEAEADGQEFADLGARPVRVRVTHIRRTAR